MNTIKINIDVIQQCFSQNVVVLPHVYSLYLTELTHLANRNKLCLLPHVVFEMYHCRLYKKLNTVVLTLPPYAQQYAIARLRKHRCVGHS